MTTLEMVVSDSSFQLTRDIDARALVAQPSSVLLAQPPIPAPRTMRLTEPASLTLLLIGMGTLVAYRGILKRLTSAVAGVAPARKGSGAYRRAA